MEGVGPDHEKEFTARVRVGGAILGEGWGRSKKVAEQQAAEAAYLALTTESTSGD
ncbi:MAG: putative dsRNA-binding protein [Actinomycetales bacterium]